MKYYFLFHHDQILLVDYAGQLQLPDESFIQAQKLALDFPFALGQWHDHELYCAAISDTLPSNLKLMDLREAYQYLDADYYRLAGRARQLIDWQRDHQFCGRCGHKTDFFDQQRAKSCSQCGLVNYPRISPCIMAAIIKDDQILLARSPHFRAGLFSVLAGFIEPSETAEDCVQREVYEEVGLYVKNVSYFKSQPWPFPNSLMLGFFAEHDHGEIKIDGIEIEAAQWFRYDQLKSIQLPLPHSLSYSLIDAFFSK